jgi:beta-phosphoglucomutase-like phosphatase (HAD superfamily)
MPLAISRDQYDAVLLDLDGVITDTANIHAACWKQMFDADTFLTAAQRLGVTPTRAVVVEDALSGVQAGHNGHFGLVIGVARKGNAEELRHHGAHLVVNDLGELVD